MNFFKRARTPEELVFKCCNAFDDLGKPMPARQAVRCAQCAPVCAGRRSLRLCGASRSRAHGGAGHRPRGEVRGRDEDNAVR
jgi:hypothetical protein